MNDYMNAYRRVPGASHFVQQDAPEETNQYMREFLEN